MEKWTLWLCLNLNENGPTCFEWYSSLLWFIDLEPIGRLFSQRSQMIHSFCPRAKSAFSNLDSKWTNFSALHTVRMRAIRMYIFHLSSYNPVFIHWNSIKHRRKCFVLSCFSLSLFLFAALKLCVWITKSVVKSPWNQEIDCHLYRTWIASKVPTSFRIFVHQATKEQIRNCSSFSPTEFCVRKEKLSKRWRKNRKRRSANQQDIHFLSEVAHWLEDT